MFSAVSNIKINSIFCVDKLLEFETIAKLNNRVILKYKGLVNNDRIPELVKQLKNKEKIVVESEKKGRIYVGYPLHVELSEENEVNYLEVTCASYSHLLDVKGKSRSFQDTSETYSSILKKVYADNEEAYILFRNFQDNIIGAPIFKYKETDWQFTLRMAARLNTVAYTNIVGEYPQAYLGASKETTPLGAYSEFSEGYNKAKYLEHKKKGLDVTYSDYYFASFRSSQNLNIGDVVSLKNNNLTVVEKHLYLKDSSIYARYTISSIQPYVLSDKYNEHLEGLTLKGTAIATESERIKVHFDIDNEQTLDKAYWFDYKPIVGNVMHTMPQLGTTVMSKFNGKEDDSLQVTHVIHENSDAVSNMSDYNKRYYTTEFRKRMAMLPDLLDFSSDDNMLELSDSTGITGKTSANFRMTSMQDIEIKSRKKTSISTPEHVYITMPGSKSVIDMAGSEINIESPNTLIKSDPDAQTLPYPTQDYAPPMSIGAGLAATAAATVPVVAKVGK